MSANSRPAPVVLTGAVYVHGALEDDFTSVNRTPAEPCRGDLRVHGHLDSRGRDNRSRGYARGGYSGQLRASLFDGSSWCVFMLAKEASPEVRRFTQVAYRAERAREIVLTLSRLKGFSCQRSGTAYYVDRRIPAQQAPLASTAKTSAPASTAKPAVAVKAKTRKAATKTPAAKAKAVTAAKPAAGPATSSCALAANSSEGTSNSKRRGKRKYRSAKGQLQLFDK